MEIFRMKSFPESISSRVCHTSQNPNSNFVMLNQVVSRYDKEAPTVKKLTFWMPFFTHPYQKGVSEVKNKII